MNSIYKDSFYENLDFISQATEPFVDNVENLYSDLPECLKISKEYILKGSTTDPRYSHIDLSHSFHYALQDKISVMMLEDPNRYKTELYEYMVDPSRFKLLFDIEIDKDTEVDIFTGESSHDIVLRKKNQSINNEDLLQYAMYRLQYFYRYGSFEYKYYDRKKVVELCDIFGVPSSNRGKDSKTLGIQLRDYILERIQNNSFRIRKYEVMKFIGVWCDNFVRSNDLAAYTNLTRFKLMTHSGRAIYSIEEAI